MAGRTFRCCSRKGSLREAHTFALRAAARMCFGEPAGAGNAARAGRAEEAGRVREDAAVAPDNVLRSPLSRGCRWARRLPSDETGDCQAFTRALAARLGGAGATLRYGCVVTGIQPSGERKFWRLSIPIRAAAIRE